MELKVREVNFTHGVHACSLCILGPFGRQNKVLRSAVYVHGAESLDTSGHQSAAAAIVHIRSMNLLPTLEG